MDTPQQQADQLNKDRASWAMEALECFEAVTGSDREDSVADLLCDPMHLCKIEGIDFGSELARASRLFQDEIFDAGGEWASADKGVRA